jgi:hypothetical protein
LADWLFYGGPIGLSAVLFLLALDLVAVVDNPIHTSRRDQLSAAGVLAIALAPMLVEPSLIAALSGVFGTAYALLLATDVGATWKQRVGDAAVLLCNAGWRAVADLFGALGQWTRNKPAIVRPGALTVWIVPLALGAIFLLLFVSANPLIEGWFKAIDLKALWALLAQIRFARLAFWLLAISLVWPFIFMQVRRRSGDKAVAESPAAGPATVVVDFPESVFGKGAILRSLILFNAIFAVQTGLDMAYLWGGVALPDGMTYAAHRGAYPLILTALLAAAFVIIAVRPDSDVERSRTIRGLVFLWTAQNVLLVISSILRLDLYVAVYSLTSLRVAAFVWMLLVAVGLVLIVARIALARSNAWLIQMNAAALALTLYACGFINFPHIIAAYNVDHSRELSGQGVPLDVGYLLSLGPQTIPALDRYFALRPAVLPSRVAGNVVCQAARRDRLAAAHLARQQDWRAWSYRDWQLANYLRTKRSDPP